MRLLKILTMELKNGIDETDIILMEYVDVKGFCDLSDYDGSVFVCYYMIGADKYKNKLWNATDDERYNKWLDEMRERDENDYEDYIDDIEQMME